MRTKSVCSLIRTNRFDKKSLFESNLIGRGVDNLLKTREHFKTLNPFFFRYLHSAVVSSGMMLIFGGNTHNDTAWSYGAKCFSADVIAYDILCDR